MKVFCHGTVVCSAHATTSALAVDNGRVVAVGNAALALRDTADEVIDLGGGTLVPGIGDGHVHPLFGAFEFRGPNIGAATSVAELQQAVREWVEANPDAEWVIGGSYDITLAPGAEFEARWLDEVTDKPVVLRAYDHHTVWVNSAALAAAGYTKDTPDPPLGQIVRYPDGTPKGTLKEAAANHVLDRVAPQRTLEERVWAIDTATRLMAEQGTTWLQDAWVEPADVDAYEVAARRDLIHTRVNLALRVDPLRWRDQVDEFVRARDRVTALGHPRLTANTVKFFMDGVIETHTAWLEQPYIGGDSTGIPNWSRKELFEATRALSEAGFQLHIHAIGDRANRTALDALAELPEETRRATPPVIAHISLIHPDQQRRFAELGVIANFEAFWAQCDRVMSEMTVPQLGEERAGWQYPIGTVVRSGATVSFGSDWPVSTPDWRAAFAMAVNRAEGDNDAWLPAERISAHDALTAYTEGIARQALAPDRGTLDVGKVADMTWLSANPLSESALSIEVRGTFIEGEMIFHG